jgi:RimJ/RimL family protein N-acetyltransferase
VSETSDIAYETERLVLRPWREADADRFADMYSRWDVVRYLGRDPKVLEGGRDEALRRMARWAELGSDDGLFGIWAAEVRATGAVAGTVLLKQLPDADGNPTDDVEVGWHLHPDSWGHGYATEGARGAIAHGFASGLREIYAVVRPDNERSLAVCRRLGLEPLGLTNRWYDTELEAFRISAPPR